ncbi:hypothetical protein [Chitinophaga polysaccharea]|uniref:hypothetical protein n=1 Tax=Chitinophaga polysaccharea TaxID=1293035 RepID=UPI00115BAD46|nr:hypothetical protein [Chitinophaga polysaccharea]
MKYCCLLLCFVITCIVSGQAIALPTGLDSSFGTNGIVTYTTPPTYGSNYNAIVIQPDGKIVAAGGAILNAVVARYLPNGTLDNTFSVQGKYIRPYTPNGFALLDLALQSDGKIVVGGQTYSNQTHDDFALIRLNSNGNIDSTFGDSGVVTTNVSMSGSSMDYLKVITLQPDGKIIAVGTTYNTLALIRYWPAGAIDSSFGTYGRVVTGTGSYGAEIGDVAIQPDNKIVVGIEAYDATNTRSFACVRYLPDGTLDTTFNHTGISYIQTGGLAYVHTMQLQPDGRILLGGAASNDLKLLRLKANGSTDSSFGVNGIATADTCIASCMVLRSDGKIVVGGYTNSNNEDFAVMQFKPNGSLDTAFGQQGKIFTPIGPGNERMEDMKLQADGKIVACGRSQKNSTSSGGDINAVIVRYQSDGRLSVINPPDVAAAQDITVYPIPAVDALHITNRSNYTITDAVLYTTDGRMIECPPMYHNTISTVQLPNGVYLLQLQLSSYPQIPVMRKIIVYH